MKIAVLMAFFFIAGCIEPFEVKCKHEVKDFGIILSSRQSAVVEAVDSDCRVLLSRKTIQLSDTIVDSKDFFNISKRPRTTH